MKKYWAAMIFVGIIITFFLYMITKERGYEQQNVESKVSFYQPEEVEETVNNDSNIRVLIKTTGFKKEYHKNVEVSAQGGLIVEDEDGRKEYENNQKVSFKSDGKTRIITPRKSGDKIKIHSIERGYGTPSYRGNLTLYSSNDGIVIVNELPLEEYLYAVVPSEMPTTYEMEALKAQAICARCYAYNQTKTMAYPEYNAHVDDSVSFQVYNNLKEQESTTIAVNETAGQKLWYEDQVAMTYFYSTSSGDSTSVEAWGTKLVDANQYLKGVTIADANGTDYEENLAWYRWSAKIPKGTMEKLIKKNTGKEIGSLKNIEITKKGSGGVVLEILVSGTKDSVRVKTENKIRKTLGGEGYKITKQDGTTINSTSLLPSAFFDIEKSEDYFIINGGGYGHGIGMSQNGANELAKAGKNYKEILEFFYPGTKVE